MSATGNKVHVVYHVDQGPTPDFIRVWTGPEGPVLDAITPLAREKGYTPQGDWDVAYPARDLWTLTTDKGLLIVQSLDEQEPPAVPARPEEG